MRVLSIKRYVAGPLDRGRELANVPSSRCLKRYLPTDVLCESIYFFLSTAPTVAYTICLQDQKVSLYRFHPCKSLASGRDFHECDQRPRPAFRSLADLATNDHNHNHNHNHVA